VVYLFPLSASTSFLTPVFFQPAPPVGANRASLSYNYIYGEHLSQFTAGIECSLGCGVQADTRLGDIYYQFTYLDANGKVIGLSDVLELKPASRLVIEPPATGLIVPDPQ
jgi:hypothetical protein